MYNISNALQKIRKYESQKPNQPVEDVKPQTLVEVDQEPMDISSENIEAEKTLTGTERTSTTNEYDLKIENLKLRIEGNISNAINEIKEYLIEELNKIKEKIPNEYKIVGETVVLLVAIFTLWKLIFK